MNQRWCEDSQDSLIIITVGYQCIFSPNKASVSFWYDALSSYTQQCNPGVLHHVAPSHHLQQNLCAIANAATSFFFHCGDANRQFCIPTKEVTVLVAIASCHLCLETLWLAFSTNTVININPPDALI